MKTLKFSGLILLITSSLMFQSCEKNIELPVCGTNKALMVGATAATVEGYIEFDGNSTEIQSGVCVAEHPNPGFNDMVQYNKKQTIEPFRIVVQDLKPMKTYYARAFAKNSKGLSFGKVISFRTGDKEIGEEYQGGNVFYILQPGDYGFDSSKCHGLICTSSDLIKELAFSNFVITTGAQGTEIGDGERNTNTILDLLDSDAPAAYYCGNLIQGGYEDWYLPSKKELFVLMEANMSFIISKSNYWYNYISSTESGEYYFYSGRPTSATGYGYYSDEFFYIPLILEQNKQNPYYSLAWPIRKF